MTSWGKGGTHTPHGQGTPQKERQCVWMECVWPLKGGGQPCEPTLPQKEKIPER